jgi:hypothetical protein
VMRLLRRPNAHGRFGHPVPPTRRVHRRVQQPWQHHGVGLAPDGDAAGRRRCRGVRCEHIRRVHGPHESLKLVAQGSDR